MSKILHAKQSRCLKSKHLLVLIYIKQNLGKDLLNYLVVEIIFCLYALKVSQGKTKSRSHRYFCSTINVYGIASENFSLLPHL